MADLTVVEVLEGAADLIASGWTKEALARNAEGKTVEPEDDDATCWCLMGATDRAAADGGSPWQVAYQARDIFRQSMGGELFCIPDWNDAPERTQDEVVAKLREAAAIARATQGDA